MRALKAVQNIPHKDDKQIGFKALRSLILEYTLIHEEELCWLEVELDDFQQEVFFNMIRRDGYPQYSAKKNRGTFRSYVFCNCKRHQIDLSRKKETRFKQLSKATGGVKRHYMVSLNQEVNNRKGDKTAELLEIIYGGSLDTSRLECSYLVQRLPEGIISIDMPISEKKLCEFFLEGYKNTEVAKFFGTETSTVEALREDIGKKLWNYYLEES